MALNPYTLYSLYDKGILEYVPTDLLMGTPMGAMMPMSNPYLDMAKQGGLYQNHGYAQDSFQFSGVQSPYVQNYQTYGNLGSVSGVGSRSNAGGMNTFNGYGVGANNTSGISNSFGFNGMTGSQTNAGVMSSFGYNVGVQNQSGFFGDSNGITGGFGKAVSIVDRTPKFVLGLLSGAIGVAGVAMAFKKGKKPPKAKTSNFLSKLNPMNWFKKTK